MPDAFSRRNYHGEHEEVGGQEDRPREKRRYNAEFD
jgi:hypothetical protein